MSIERSAAWRKGWEDASTGNQPHPSKRYGAKALAEYKDGWVQGHANAITAYAEWKKRAEEVRG